MDMMDAIRKAIAELILPELGHIRENQSLTNQRLTDMGQRFWTT